ncbi:MAG: FixH family protein [Bdellovibrionales bacterium]
MVNVVDPRSCRWVPWSIAGAFALLTAVLGLMTYLSIHDFPGLWTEHAYEKGLAYNAALKAASAQDALGWKGELTATPEQDRQIAVNFKLTASEAKPIEGAQVKLWFVRPASAAMDREIALKPLENGHYAASATLPASGVWDLKVSAVYAGQNYQLTKRIMVP